MKKTDFSLRYLRADDWQALKILRMRALTSVDSRFFVANGKPEQAKNATEWQQACAAIFDRNGRGLSVTAGGLSIEHNWLLGSGSAMRWSDDPTGQTAHYRGIYVLPPFRKLNIAKGIEDMLDAWAIENGYTSKMLTIRAEKEEWLQRYTGKLGFDVIGETSLVYANGESAHTYFLQRSLIASNQNTQSHAAFGL